MHVRIRARKAARRGETYTPERRNSLTSRGLDAELGESGVNGFAEYHGGGQPGDVALGNDEVDDRFRKVFEMEAMRGSEHQAADELTSERTRSSAIEVGVEV